MPHASIPYRWIPPMDLSATSDRMPLGFTGGKTCGTRGWIDINRWCQRDIIISRLSSTLGTTPSTLGTTSSTLRTTPSTWSLIMGWGAAMLPLITCLITLVPTVLTLVVSQGHGQGDRCLYAARSPPIFKLVVGWVGGWEGQWRCIYGLRGQLW